MLLPHTSEPMTSELSNVTEIRVSGCSRDCTELKCSDVWSTMPTTPLEVITPMPFSIPRSEEHTSELQSRENLVCRLLLEKKKKQQTLQRTETRCQRMR